jgi:hypothetical protein
LRTFPIRGRRNDECQSATSPICPQGREKGIPELADKVDRGEIGVSVASKVASLPKEKQRKIVAMAKPARAAALQKIKLTKSQRANVQAEISRRHSRYGKQSHHAEPRDVMTQEEPTPAADTLQSIAAQKADQYFAEQTERLGPIIAPIMTEEQRQHIDGAIASLKMIRTRLANNGIHDFTGEIDLLIERMTILGEKATAA